jgi:hypothetical protein
MRAGLLLFPAALFISSFAIAQDEDQPAPSSHPIPENITAVIPQPKHDDSPLLTRYARVNQMKYIIEPDLDFGFVHGKINIGLAPTVGHKIWKGLYAGAGLVYIYSGQRNVLFDVAGQSYSVNASQQTYGGGVFVQYNIWKGLYVRVRFDLLHREIDDLENTSVTLNQTTGKWEVKVPRLKMNIPDLPVGVGYNILVKKNLFLPIKISYNILYPFLNKQYTVYPDGWIVKLCVFNIF